MGLGGNSSGEEGRWVAEGRAGRVGGEGGRVEGKVVVWNRGRSSPVNLTLVSSDVRNYISSPISDQTPED